MLAKLALMALAVGLIAVALVLYFSWKESAPQLPAISEFLSVLQATHYVQASGRFQIDSEGGQARREQAWGTFQIRCRGGDVFDMVISTRTAEGERIKRISSNGEEVIVTREERPSGSAEPSVRTEVLTCLRGSGALIRPEIVTLSVDSAVQSMEFAYSISTSNIDRYLREVVQRRQIAPVGTPAVQGGAIVLEYEVKDPPEKGGKAIGHVRSIWAPRGKVLISRVLTRVQEHSRLTITEEYDEFSVGGE